MIGILVTGFYNLIEAYFVRGLGTSQMGTVSVTFPLGQATVGLAQKSHPAFQSGLDIDEL
jgi:hypothetical protein